MNRPHISHFIAAVCSLLVFWIATASASELVQFDPAKVDQKKVAVSGDGEELRFDLAQASGKFDADTAFPGSYNAGWYKIRAEYKTPGLSPFSRFVFHTLGGGVLSPCQSVPAASDWAPLEVFTYLKNDGCLSFRVHFDALPQGMGKNEALQIRNVHIESYQTPGDRELLVNGDLASGVLGEVPPMWSWQYQAEPGDHRLVADDTFQTGKQTIEIKAAEKGRSLTGFSRPLETSGRMEFSVWARSEQGATMTIRLLGNSYKWDASKTVNLTPTWTKYSVAKECTTAVDPTYFFPRIDISGEGSARIAGTSLIWIKETTPAVPVDEKPTASSSANLIENGDFDFGWNGWMYYPGAIVDAPECRVVPDGGKGDGRALYLSQRFGLVSKCFPIAKGKIYTVSANVKALGKQSKLQMFVIDTNWKNKNGECADLPVGEWKRVSLKAAWNFDSQKKKGYARFDGTDVLVDKIQVCEDGSTQYRQPALALGVLAENGNVFRQGEEIKGLTLKSIPAQGGPKTIWLSAKVSDAWGKVLWTKAWKASGKKTTVFPLELPGDRLGVFEVTVVATGLSKKDLTKTQSRYAVIRDVPKTAQELPKFGAHLEVFSGASWVSAKYADLLQRMGAGMNRSFVSENAPWSKGEIQTVVQGKYERASSALGSQILCVGGGDIFNKLRRGEAEFSQQMVDDYVALLKSYVVPLQKQVRYWEVLNEPNIWSYQSGPQKGQRSLTPDRYIRFLKASYEAVKAINPDLKVVGGCINGCDFEYLNQVMKFGAGKYMDVFSIHAYRGAPDIPDTYSDLMKIRKILTDHGFSGPVVNDEQYYAADLYMMPGQDAETGRDYYSSANEELLACSKTVEGLIHTSAAGIFSCPFAPQSTQAALGGCDQVFLFYLYGAFNAEALFLGNAGDGSPIKIGDSMKAFLFADAPEGPLVAFYAPDPKAAGVMYLKGEFAAYDMMGNRLENTDSKGLPISVTPVYVRFPKGTTVDKITQQLTSSDLTGLGDPFNLKLTLKDEHTVDVTVLNMQNKTLNGDVRIDSLPKGWKLDQSSLAFANLQPGETAHLAFKGDLSIANLAEYHIGIVASSGDKFTKKEADISPVLATYRKNIHVDGRFDDWQGAEWINLGEDHLSANFNEKVPHKGSDDLSAKVATSWNEKALMLAFEVNDDVMVYPESPSMAWKDDSVQLYFDQRLNAAKPNSLNDGDDIVYTISASKDGKAHAWLQKGCDGRYIGEANQSTGLDGDGEVSSRREGNKTFYEIKFPAKCFPLVSFQKGNSIGFSLLINDNDGKGRKQGLTLAPKGTQPYDKPYYYRNLIFR